MPLIIKILHVKPPSNRHRHFRRTRDAFDFCRERQEKSSAGARRRRRFWTKGHRPRLHEPPTKPQRQKDSKPWYFRVLESLFIPIGILAKKLCRFQFSDQRSSNRTSRNGFPMGSHQTVDKTPACFPRWGFVLRIKNNKKRLIYAVFWRFCGIMIVTNLK